jgi:hypothetical protein
LSLLETNIGPWFKWEGISIVSSKASSWAVKIWLLKGDRVSLFGVAAWRL